MTEQPDNRAGRIILVTVLLSVGYAVLRYHVAGPVPWKDFPFFILNKGICLAAFLLLTLNFSLGPLNNLGLPVSPGWLNARKALGMTGFLMVLIHVLMSFMLFSPAVYAKFFVENGTLTLLAGLSMLFGVLICRLVGLQHELPDLSARGQGIHPVHHLAPVHAVRAATRRRAPVLPGL